MINNIYRLPRCWVVPLKYQEVVRYIIGQQNHSLDSVQLINGEISRLPQCFFLLFNFLNNKMKNLAVFALLVSAVTAAAVGNISFSCPDQSWGGCCAEVDEYGGGHTCKLQFCPDYFFVSDVVANVYLRQAKMQPLSRVTASTFALITLSTENVVTMRLGW